MSGIKSLPMVEARKLKGARRCFRPGRENTSVRISAKRRRMRFHLRRSVPHGSSQGRFLVLSGIVVPRLSGIVQAHRRAFLLLRHHRQHQQVLIPCADGGVGMALGAVVHLAGQRGCLRSFQDALHTPRRKTGGPSSLFIAPAPPPASADPHPLR